MEPVRLNRPASLAVINRVADLKARLAAETSAPIPPVITTLAVMVEHLREEREATHGPSDHYATLTAEVSHYEVQLAAALHTRLHGHLLALEADIARTNPSADPKGWEALGAEYARTLAALAAL